MRIAVDAMGGDHAPGAVVEGAVAAARDLGVSILLVGDRTRVEPLLVKLKTKGLDIEMRHAAEEVGMDEAPTAALRKSDCSLAVVLTAVRDGDAGGAVFAGNTGAGMVLGAHVLGCVRGVERPAIGVQVPSARGRAILVDAGANVDSRGTHLVQFALMGDAYARTVRHVAAPRVGLLSNGTEEGKGSASVREAAPILRRLPIHYVGYVEARDLFAGNVDVVVCDGFVGNVALKSIEGFGALVEARLRAAVGRGLLPRLAGLILRRPLRAMGRDLDPGETGGALLLGLNGTLVKAHGSSDARAIRNAIGVASELATARVSDEVERSVAVCLERFAIEGAVQPEEGAEAGRAHRLWNAIRTRFRREKTTSAGTSSPAAASPASRSPVEPSATAPEEAGHGGATAPEEAGHGGATAPEEAGTTPEAVDGGQASPPPAGSPKESV